MRFSYRYMVLVSGFDRTTSNRWTLFVDIYSSVRHVRDCARKFYDDPRFEDDVPDVYVIRYCPFQKAFNSASFYMVGRSDGRFISVAVAPSFLNLLHSSDFSPLCR